LHGGRLLVLVGTLPANQTQPLAGDSTSGATDAETLLAETGGTVAMRHRGRARKARSEATTLSSLVPKHEGER
jgi:hypothetical protein